MREAQADFATNGHVGKIMPGAETLDRCLRLMEEWRKLL